MFVRALILMAGIMLLTCGCNKGQQASSQQAAGKSSAKAGSQVDTVDDSDNLLEDTAEIPTPEALEGRVRVRLLQLATEHQVEADINEDQLHAKDDPTKSVGISDLATQLANTILSSNEPISDGLIDDHVVRALESLTETHNQTAVSDANAEGEPTQTTTPVDAGEENLEPYKNKPVVMETEVQIPEKIIGIWHSIAEIKDKTIVNHDDNYYDIVDFRDRTNGSYSTYRNNIVNSHLQFTYSFDPKTGRLIIRFEDGNVWTVLMQQPVDNPAELRFTKITEGLTTVYRLS